MAKGKLKSRYGNQQERKLNMQLVSFLFGCFLLISMLSSPASAETQWNVGLSIGNEGIRNFNLSIGEYYRVPEREVIVVRERGFRDEELPVIFFISSRARVAPRVVIDLRSRGWSWMDITLHFGLSPAIYYVPIKEGRVGPPYGKAYGYYKKHPRHDGKRIPLTDDDVVNLVNLRFISEHHGYPPEAVMKMRAEGRNFVAINETVYEDRHGKKKDDNGDRGDKGKKGRESWNEKGKGKGKKW